MLDNSSTAKGLFNCKKKINEKKLKAFLFAAASLL